VTYSTERDSLISAGNLETLATIAGETPAGAFVEVGVYRGGSARALYRVAEEQGRELYLFDTFEGHPTPSTSDDVRAHPEGRYADCADPVALRAEMPNASIVRGRFPDTWLWTPSPWRWVAFVHIDVDLYESTRDAILALTPAMVPGGVMYFDDYGVAECPGATKAVHELFANWEHLPNGKALVRFGR
jgi:O-methyltransferase